MSGRRSVPDRPVEGGGEDLRVVARELQARDALGVRAVELALHLAGGHLPHLDLAVVGAGRQRVAVAPEGQRQHGLLHAHVLLVRLVAQVLADLARGEVPHLHQTVHGARHQVLPVRRKPDE